MNASEKGIERNPWRRTKERPHTEPKDLVLASAAVFVCAAVLGGAVPSDWMWLVTAALFACVVVTVRSVGSVLLLLSVTLVASLLSFSMDVGTTVLATMVGTGSLAWILTVLQKHRYLGIVALVAAFGVCWGITSDPLLSALAFAFLPAAVLMAVATFYDVGRTNTVLYTLGGFLLSGAVILGVALYRLYGSVSFEVLRSFVEDLRAAGVEAVRGTGYLIWDTLMASAEEAKLPADQLEKLRDAYNAVFSESGIHALVNSVIGLAPALIFVPTVILSFGSHLFLLRRYYNTAWRKMMTPRSCTVTVSATASVLYFICFMLVLFVPRESLVLTAIRNLFLILLPGLSLVGVNTLVFQIRHARGWGGVIWILLLLLMLCCSGFSFVYFLAMWGAYAVIATRLRRKMMQIMKDQNGRED